MKISVSSYSFQQYINAGKAESGSHFLPHAAGAGRNGS